MILLTRHGEDDDSRLEAGIQYTNKEVRMIRKSE